jgi:transposase
MAKPYAMDLRARAMRRVAAGASAHSVAAVLRVSVSSVVKWAQRQRRTGSVAPGKMGGHRPRRVSGDAGRAMEPTIEAAQDRLASVLDTIPPNACANYFSGAGYAAT